MKRGTLPFDTSHFKKLQKQGKNLNIEETFQEIYQSNHWSGSESISGQGSDDHQTLEIRKQIPKLIAELGIERFLDVPCGDFHWFSKMDLKLTSYVGGDIIADIVHKNNQLYSNKGRMFVKLDLLKDPLPEADILHCRDCLVHLSFEDIDRAIQNIKASDIKYLLTTTFPKCDINEDITTGDWRVINLEKPPFSFPAPMKLINEKCTEINGTYADKSLGLWSIKDI